MDSHKLKEEKVLAISSKECPLCPNNIVSLTTKLELPKAKHPKITILQGIFVEHEITCKEEEIRSCVKRPKLEENAKSVEPTIGKENINTMKHTKLVIGKSSRPFSNLDMLLEVVNKLDRKVQSKTLRKRVMMDSPEAIIPSLMV